MVTRWLRCRRQVLRVRFVLERAVVAMRIEARDRWRREMVGDVAVNPTKEVR